MTSVLRVVSAYPFSFPFFLFCSLFNLIILLYFHGKSFYYYVELHLKSFFFVVVAAAGSRKFILMDWDLGIGAY